MRQIHKAGVALLAGLAGLGCGSAALADNPGAAPESAPQQPPQSEAPDTRGSEAPPAAPQEGKQKGYGAGIGGQEMNREQGSQKTSSSQWFIIGPLDTGAGVGAGQGGYGAGVGGSGEAPEPGKPSASAPAPVPQYWLADASLFTASAGNAAQTLANEQTLGVQSPAVLGNQAQFLLASTDRALSSLKALQANAEAINPRAVADIRAAMDQLVAAKGQAQQALDAANGGTLGPSHQATIRSAYEHLQGAEKDIAAAGRAYGTQGFTLASVCNFHGGRGLGAGIGGGKGSQQKAPEKSTPAPEKAPAPEKSGTPAPDQGATPPAPPPPPGGEKP